MNTDLHAACEAGDLHKVWNLVKQHGGAKPTAECWMISVVRGHVHIVAFLLRECGIDINVFDGSLAAIHVAVRNKDIPMLQFLLTHGADVNATMANNGVTPLMMAAESGVLYMVRALLECHAEVDAMDTTYGDTALMWALKSKECCTEIVRLLLSEGANVETINKDGERPLLVAVERGMLEVMEVLLFHGADILVRNQKGESIQTIAKNKNHVTIIDYLSVYGKI